MLQASAIEKCIQSDTYLLKKYNEIQEGFDSELDLLSAFETLQNALEKNKALVTNFFSKRGIDSIF